MNVTYDTTTDDLGDIKQLTELRIDNIHLKQDNTDTFERDVVNIIDQCIPAKKKAEELYGDDSAVDIGLDLHKNNDDVIIAKFTSLTFKYTIEYKLSTENFRLFCYDTGVLSKSKDMEYIVELGQEL
jgi:hypothetical protein